MDRKMFLLRRVGRQIDWSIKCGRVSETSGAVADCKQEAMSRTLWLSVWLLTWRTPLVFPFHGSISQTRMETTCPWLLAFHSGFSSTISCTKCRRQIPVWYPDSPTMSTRANGVSNSRTTWYLTGLMANQPTSQSSSTVLLAILCGRDAPSIANSVIAVSNCSIITVPSSRIAWLSAATFSFGSFLTLCGSMLFSIYGWQAMILREDGPSWQKKRLISVRLKSTSRFSSRCH